MLGQTVQVIAVGLLGYAISKNNHNQINGFLAMAGVGVGMSLGSLELQSRFLLKMELNAVASTMNLFVRTISR